MLESLFNKVAGLRALRTPFLNGCSLHNMMSLKTSQSIRKVKQQAKTVNKESLQCNAQNIQKSQCEKKASFKRLTELYLR